MVGEVNVNVDRKPKTKQIQNECGANIVVDTVVEFVDEDSRN